MTFDPGRSRTVTPMGTYGISEAARRSGFTPSTLRYYENVGVVPAPDRSESGYRIYDDAAVARLAFVARAKQLGCTLDEITALVEAWDGDRCEPVQRTLRELVARKAGETASRAAELSELAAELRSVGVELGTHTPDGPCDDRCACAAPVATEAPEIACTLGAGDVAERVAAWQGALAGVTARAPVPGGVRLTLGGDSAVGEVAALAAAEQGCCSFFRFALTFDERGAALEVRAPAEAHEVLQALFG